MYNIYHIILAFIIGAGLGKTVVFLQARRVCKKKGCELGFWDMATWWKK